MAAETETIHVRRLVRTARCPGLTAAGVVTRAVMWGAVTWGAVFALAMWAIASQFSSEYPTAAARAQLTETVGSNVGVEAIFGPADGIATVAGYTAYHAVGLLGIIGAVWGLLAATRLLRGEEEAGRWELLLAGVTTRRRATAAAMAGLGIGLLALWAVTAVGTVAVGQTPGAGFSVTGSLFTAVATVAAASMFLAVGALCSQLAATRRQAAGLAAGVFGVAYLLRAVAYSAPVLRWLRWVSPLGWVDELRPLTGSRPLLLVPIVGFIAALVVLTILLAGRRDLGAGALPAHRAAASRTGSLHGPFGLAYRLALPSALGWIGGLATGGLILGLTAKAAAAAWANQQGGAYEELGGTAGGAAYLGISFLIITLLVAMAAAGQVSAIRDEEAEGYLDHLLARPVARGRWLAGRFAVSAAALAAFGIFAGLFAWVGAAATGAGLALPTLIAAGINTVPAGVLVLGIGTLVYGLAPRSAAAISYGVVAWSFLVEVVGAGLGASRWLLDLDIFHYVARAPATSVRWDSAAALVVIGIAAAAIGALALARRDLQGA